MDRTIRLLLVVVLVGACSAGSGYNYIRPAKNVVSSGPIVNSDGSTKSVYVFADPDEHQQRRTVSYRQSAPSYSRSRTTYSNVAPQQRRVTYTQAVPQQRSVSYRQVVPQQRSVTYSQVVPQQNTIRYNQIQPQQKSVTYSQQTAPQQRTVIYNNVAPQQQQISYTANQGASQQLPYVTNQIVPQQIPISYTQVGPQQQPIAYNQIAPQQIPIISNQIAPQQQQFDYTTNQIVPQQQQFQYSNNQFAPTVKKNLQVIFVKTPGYEAYTEALLKMAKEAIQSQTIVYVLSKEPDIEELTRRFKEIQSTARKMPEVRFIKYKTDDEAVQAQQAIQAQYDSLPGTSSTFGIPIGTGIGTQSETGSINNNYSINSAGPTSEISSTSALLPLLPLTTTTSNEDDSQNSPPFLPTGIDVVPGSSYLPPNQSGN